MKNRSRSWWCKWLCSRACCSSLVAMKLSQRDYGGCTQKCWPCFISFISRNYSFLIIHLHFSNFPPALPLFYWTLNTEDNPSLSTWHFILLLYYLESYVIPEWVNLMYILAQVIIVLAPTLIFSIIVAIYFNSM